MRPSIQLFILILSFTISIGFAQDLPRCAHLENEISRITEGTQRRKAFETFDQNFRTWTNEDTGGVFVIQVVVHVLHAVEDQTIGTGTNISRDQINSQIRILNEDFRKTFGSPGFNDHPDGADTEIEFCLAIRDPDGNESSGITRDTIHKTDLKYPQDDEYIKSKNYWPPTSYLNIYVIPSLTNNALGYAQKPWKFQSSPNTDGVVIVHRFFGDVGSVEFQGNPYNTGRTTTHEVGHYLGLSHVWGDINGCGFPDLPDSIDDTPDASSANYGCRINQFSCNSPDMVENYLDYSNDTCFNIFTQGQKTFMRYVLSSGDHPHRTSLIINSGDCSGNLISGEKVFVSATPSPEIIKIGGLEPLGSFSLSLHSSTGRVTGPIQGTANLYGEYLLNIREVSDGFVILRVVQNNGRVESLKAVLTL